MTTQKIVAIVYGGKSSEHEISLISAASVLNNIDRTLFAVRPIAIDKDGQWWEHDDTLLLTANHESLPVKSDMPITMLEALQGCDVVFPVLHGPRYEDGAIQGFFELLELPYVGAGVMTSSVAMDKVTAKQIIEQAGIPTAPYQIVYEHEWHNDQTAILDTIMLAHPFPLFVKPARAGSSVGVHRVSDRETLCTSINDALRYDNKLLVEQAVVGRELEVALLEDLSPTRDLIISKPGEVHIGSGHEFYSYDAKYAQASTVQTTVPAKIADGLIERAQLLAARIFRLLDCSGLLRVDLFFDEANNAFYFNEANTLPGFTPISLYPKMMAEAGIAYQPLITHLLLAAIVSTEQRQRRLTDGPNTQTDKR